MPSRQAYPSNLSQTEVLIYNSELNSVFTKDGNMPSPTFFIVIDSIRVELFISKYHCNVLFVQSMVGKYSEEEAGVTQAIMVTMTQNGYWTGLFPFKCEFHCVYLFSSSRKPSGSYNAGSS